MSKVELEDREQAKMSGGLEVSIEVQDETIAIERLLGLGRSQGYVTYDDVMEAIPEAELNIEQLEDALAALIERGIDICDAELAEPIVEE